MRKQVVGVRGKVILEAARSLASTKRPGQGFTESSVAWIAAEQELLPFLLIRDKWVWFEQCPGIIAWGSILDNSVTFSIVCVLTGGAPLILYRDNNGLLTQTKPVINNGR